MNENVKDYQEYLKFKKMIFNCLENNEMRTTTLEECYDCEKSITCSTRQFMMNESMDV